MVERDGLENRCILMGTESSNLSPSAINEKAEPEKVGFFCFSNLPGNDQELIINSWPTCGKTTNALEEVVWADLEGRDPALKIEEICSYHHRINVAVNEGPTMHPIELKYILDYALRLRIVNASLADADRYYDEIASCGEMASTRIVSNHLVSVGIANTWMDARDVIRTDNLYRSARVDWETSQKQSDAVLCPLFKKGAKPCRVVTQGFIGATKDGRTTTLGREGSDFSAAIFAYLLDAESVTIWKDVPGMFNADPKLFPDTKLLEHISYKEAIELSYFGASVIHPRTLQPLQRKNIPLYVRSFIDLDAKGSTISEATDHDTLIPSFIIKPEQVLLSITPRDLSFIVEENLSGIFASFSSLGVRINMMQNSAVAFTVCVDNDQRLKPLVMELRRNYEVRWNEGLELLTVRHPDDATLTNLTKGRDILLEQRSRTTARFALK